LTLVTKRETQCNHAFILLSDDRICEIQVGPHFVLKCHIVPFGGGPIEAIFTLKMSQIELKMKSVADIARSLL
jgi:hypothetical protein